MSYEAQAATSAPEMAGTRVPFPEFGNVALHDTQPEQKRNPWKWPVALAAAVALAACDSSPAPPSPAQSQSSAAEACPEPAALPAPWSPATKSGTAVGEGVKKVDFSTFLIGRNNRQALDERLDQLAAASVSHVRFDTAWREIEPTRCEYDWAGLDPWMEGLAARHITALMIVGKTPVWAADTPNCNAAGKCPPRNPDDYGAFAEALATRYAQFEPDIEMVNEIKNIPPHVYASMCGNAYRRIKQASPDSLVLFGSKAPVDARDKENPERPANFFRAVDSVRNRDGTRVCKWDAMSAHPYTDPINGRILAGQDDEANGWGQMLELRQATEAAGAVARPFWITEFGIAQPDQQVPQLDAALNQLDAYPWATKFFWYTLRDDPANKNYFGALNPEGEPKPIFAQIQQFNQST